MSKLITAILVLTLIGCEREEPAPPEEAMEAEEAPPEAVAPDDTVAFLGPSGGWVTTPQAKACIGLPASPTRDSMRVAITRLSPGPDRLPDLLPPQAAAFEAAHGQGQVFAPMYDFSVSRHPSGEAIKTFPDSIYVGICVYRPGLAPIPDVVLAHPNPDDTTKLQAFREVVPVPDACALICDEGPGSLGPNPLRRWLAGSPVTPSPAYASLAEDGTGGKGPGPSPIAAVRRGAPNLTGP